MATVAGSPSRRTQLTSVASTASCWQTTSLRRATCTKASRFMSARRTLRATRAPASRQTWPVNAAQEHSEKVSGNGDIRMCRHDTNAAACMWVCLRRQQCLESRRKVCKNLPADSHAQGASPRTQDSRSGPMATPLLDEALVQPLQQNHPALVPNSDARARSAARSTVLVTLPLPRRTLLYPRAELLCPPCQPSSRALLASLRKFSTLSSSMMMTHARLAPILCPKLHMLVCQMSE